MRGISVMPGAVAMRVAGGAARPAKDDLDDTIPL